MLLSPYETIDLLGALPEPVRRDDSAADLTPHFVRIVRRALRRTDDRSPLACAIRSAVALAAPEAGQPSYDAETRVQQVARRVSALLTPDFRDPPGRGAHRETVCA